MKDKTIWNLEDILENYTNLRCDLQFDYKDIERTPKDKELIRQNLKINASKIKELKDCIKWVKKQNDNY